MAATASPGPWAEAAVGYLTQTLNAYKDLPFWEEDPKITPAKFAAERTLTAGGLDPCLRMSHLAARVTLRFLETGDPSCLEAYHGTDFRARFRSRLLLRRLLASVRSPAAAELACAVLRLPLVRRVAEHVYFGSGSFPDVPAPARAGASHAGT